MLDLSSVTLMVLCGLRWTYLTLRDDQTKSQSSSSMQYYDIITYVIL